MTDLTVAAQAEAAIRERGCVADGWRVTDAGNAERLIELAGGRIRYVPKWGKWIVFRDGVWLTDYNDAYVTEAAKAVSKRLFALSMQAQDSETNDERSRVFKAGLRAESAGAIASMVRLAPIVHENAGGR